MSKIVLLLFVLSALVISCGKDDKKKNQVANPYGYQPPIGGPGIPGGGGGYPLPPGQQYPGYNSFQAFVTAVQSGQFRDPGPVFAEYYYLETVIDVDTSDWWIFDFTTYSSSTSEFIRSRNPQGIFEHEFCSPQLAVICDRAYLSSRFVSLLQNTTNYYPVSNTRFMVQVSVAMGAQVIYEFDLSKDIVANPITKQVINGPEAGSGYYLYSGFSY